jgi:nucleoside-diphosphate-sugar epimerase
MRKKITLITGASGEIGQALIKSLKESSDLPIITLDLTPLPEDVQAMVTALQGDILDKALLARLVSEYEIDTIYHLAALLSTRSEFTPETAHRVNVEGTLGLLKMAAEQSEWRGQPVKFIFPSSIAAYGLPDWNQDRPCTCEWEWNTPRTMYGCNKLYCEQLGIYFSEYYRQLATERPVMVDFRCLRFPGLISAYTVPAAAPRLRSKCCAMPPEQALRLLCARRCTHPVHGHARRGQIAAHAHRAERAALNHHVYNVTSFSLSAVEFRDWVLKFFPKAQIAFQPDIKRQAIVDSWPADLDDSAAQRNWGWSPDYSVERSFSEYLVPNIRARYQGPRPLKTNE